MENVLSQILVELQLLNQRVGGLEQGQQELKTSVQKIESKVDRLELRLENEAFYKIGALFDGFSLRGDQIENLRRHIDERFDTASKLIPATS